MITLLLPSHVWCRHLLAKYSQFHLCLAGIFCFYVTVPSSSECTEQKAIFGVIKTKEAFCIFCDYLPYNNADLDPMSFNVFQSLPPFALFLSCSPTLCASLSLSCSYPRALCWSPKCCKIANNIHAKHSDMGCFFRHRLKYIDVPRSPTHSKLKRSTFNWKTK